MFLPDPPSMGMELESSPPHASAPKAPTMAIAVKKNSFNSHLYYQP